MYVDEQAYLKRYPWKAGTCPVCGELYRKRSKQVTCRDPQKGCADIYAKWYEKERRARFKQSHPNYHRDHQRQHRAAAKARKGAT